MIKVGDTVKIINNSRFDHALVIGSVGVVKHIYVDGVCQVYGKVSFSRYNETQDVHKIDLQTIK